MPSTLMTPGVYIEEKNAFPGSAVAVATAIPAFIGFTDIAEKNGKSLVGKPFKISSYAEYSKYFGIGFNPKFTISEPEAATDPTEIFTLNKIRKTVKIKNKHSFYLYNSIRLFYANGGSDCYIVSTGTYGDQPNGLEVKKDVFINALDLLKKEYEPTLLVMPDAIQLGTDCYASVYTYALQHCNEMQSRFAIFDIIKENEDGTDGLVKDFRYGIGVNFLNYGAAYYPWLKTSIVDASELDFENIDVAATTNLKELLPEANAQLIIDNAIKDNPDVFGTAAVKTDTTKIEAGTEVVQGEPSDPKLQETTVAQAGDVQSPEVVAQQGEEKAAETTTQEGEKPVAPVVKVKTADDIISIKRNFHQSLKAASPSYAAILEEIRSRINELPPSGAMAGIYTLVDNNRGVWKSPANVSLSNVSAPLVNVTHDEQQGLNVDVMAGKSINVIRPFPGIGTLVWGGRTLDGNSQDWKYINVRRTLIMIEQSLKLATRAYVFEPNDGTTWSTINSMFSNFLTNLWKQGALFGSTPEQAFAIQVGLGLTMTPSDILDGILRITVKVAVVRPAEFIVITFQQQLQQA